LSTGNYKSYFLARSVRLRLFENCSNEFVISADIQIAAGCHRAYRRDNGSHCVSYHLWSNTGSYDLRRPLSTGSVILSTGRAAVTVFFYYIVVNARCALVSNVTTKDFALYRTAVNHASTV